MSTTDILGRLKDFFMLYDISVRIKESKKLL